MPTGSSARRRPRRGAITTSALITVGALLLACAHAPPGPPQPPPETPRDASSSPLVDSGAPLSTPSASSASLRDIDASAAAASSATGPRASVGIRGVDWCNLGYPAPLPVLSRCEGSFDERHRAGEGIHSIDRYRLATVTYGDLTGDGREDALVVVSGEVHPVLIGDAPLSTIGWVALAELQGDSVVILDAIATGAAPVVSVSIAKGTATVVRRRAGRECSARWRWEGGRLKIHPTTGPCDATP